MTIHEAAAFLKGTPEWLRQQCEAGNIDWIHRSGTKRKTRLFEREALERFIASRRVERDVEIHERVRSMRRISGAPDVLGPIVAARGRSRI